jgi:hypothetical protein
MPYTNLLRDHWTDVQTGSRPVDIGSDYVPIPGVKGLMQAATAAAAMGGNSPQQMQFACAM